MSFIAGSRLVVTDTTSPADRLHASAFIQSNPTTSIQNLQKPLYRKDIFYSGSVMNVTHIKSHMSLKSYVASVTSIPQEVRLINFHLQNHINTKHVLVAVPVLTNIVGGFCPPPPPSQQRLSRQAMAKHTIYRYSAVIGVHSLYIVCMENTSCCPWLLNQRLWTFNLHGRKLPKITFIDVKISFKAGFLTMYSPSLKIVYVKLLKIFIYVT